MKQWDDIAEEWKNLIKCVHYEYVFGEPLDNELFKECMKDIYDYFCIGKEKKKSYNSRDMQLYGLICGYSYIPAVTESDFSDEFGASLLAAFTLSEGILHPTARNFQGSKMICKVQVGHGEFKSFIYDFETGDLTDFVELARMGFLIGNFG